MGGEGCDKLQVLEKSAESGFSWSLKAALPAARYCAASATVEGNLWLIGGYVEGPDSHDESDNVDVYDIASDAWTKGPTLPYPEVFRAAVHDGEVYVTSSKGTLRYDGAAWVDTEGGYSQFGACESVLLG